MDNAATDRRALLLPLGTFVASLIVWYFFSVQLGWGEAVSKHDPRSIWGYVLKLWMIGMALGLPLLAGYGHPRDYGWRITLPWLVIILAIGLGQGAVNRGGYSMGVIAVLGAGLHSLGGGHVHLPPVR